MLRRVLHRWQLRSPPTVFYDVTFNVNMANEDVSSDGVFLAGGAHFGWPGDNPMSDDDGDGIWSITVNLAEGTAGKFLNGNCGDCLSDNNGARKTVTVESAATPTTTTTAFTVVTGGRPPGSAHRICRTTEARDVDFRWTCPNTCLKQRCRMVCCIAMSDDDGDGIYDVTWSSALA